MTKTGHIILRANIILGFELVLTDNNVYFCQKVSRYRNNNRVIEDKYLQIQDIYNLSIINDGINILSLQLMALYIRDGYRPL